MPWVERFSIGMHEIRTVEPVASQLCLFMPGRNESVLQLISPRYLAPSVAQPRRRRARLGSVLHAQLELLFPILPFLVPILLSLWQC